MGGGQLTATITKTGPRSTDLLLEKMTPGQYNCLKRALREVQSPVADQILEEIEDVEAWGGKRDE